MGCAWAGAGDCAGMGLLLGLRGTCEYLPESSHSSGERGRSQGRAENQGEEPAQAACSGERRMNGPDQDEEPFLSYRSYERERRSRGEAQRGGRETPNGGGGWKREGK